MKCQHFVNQSEPFSSNICQTQAHKLFWMPPAMKTRFCCMTHTSQLFLLLLPLLYCNTWNLIVVESNLKWRNCWQHKRELLSAVVAAAATAESSGFSLKKPAHTPQRLRTRLTSLGELNLSTRRPTHVEQLPFHKSTRF